MTYRQTVMRSSRMRAAISLSFMTGWPLARSVHFNCGTCCRSLQPSMPCAQTLVLALTLSFSSWKIRQSSLKETGALSAEPAYHSRSRDSPPSPASAVVSMAED